MKRTKKAKPFVRVWGSRRCREWYWMLLEPMKGGDRWISSGGGFASRRAALAAWRKFQRDVAEAKVEPAKENA